nr:MAG TPA: hypothetical protein [Caudoviricetes sp.]
MVIIQTGLIPFVFYINLKPKLKEKEVCEL